MNSEKQIQLYLEGSLKGLDLQDFKQRLKNDEAFRKLFLNYQKAWNLIEKQYRNLSSKDRLKERSGASKSALSFDEVKAVFGEFFAGNDSDLSSEEKLKQLLDSIMKKRKGKIRKLGIILVIAAGIVLVLGIPVAFHHNLETKNSAMIYDQYFEPYPFLMHERSIPDSDSTLEKDAMYLYNMHEYESAAGMLEKNNNDSISNPLRNLYLGICYMELKKYSEAISIFEKVISQRQDLTYIQARWFLGLSYLKLNMRDLAGQQLTILQTDSGMYTKQAREILNKLKQY